MLYAIYTKYAGWGRNGFWGDDELIHSIVSYNKTSVRKAKAEGKNFAHIFKKQMRAGMVYYEYQSSTTL